MRVSVAATPDVHIIPLASCPSNAYQWPLAHIAHRTVLALCVNVLYNMARETLLPHPEADFT